MPGMTQIKIYMDSPKIAATWCCDRQGFVDPIGDINYDGKVDMNDIAMIARRYGAKVGGPKYKLACDIYLDRKIDIHDLVTVARNLQK